MLFSQTLNSSLSLPSFRSTRIWETAAPLPARAPLLRREVLSPYTHTFSLSLSPLAAAAAAAGKDRSSLSWLSCRGGLLLHRFYHPARCCRALKGPGEKAGLAEERMKSPSLSLSLTPHCMGQAKAAAYCFPHSFEGGGGGEKKAERKRGVNGVVIHYVCSTYIHYSTSLFVLPFMWFFPCFFSL